MLNDPNDTTRDDYDPADDATDWVLSSNDSLERGEDGYGEDDSVSRRAQAEVTHG